jgi:large subunit ribosomal protein L6
MSRIGKKPINIPEKVEITINGQDVTIKGPKGELSRTVRPEILIKKEDGKIKLSIQKEGKKSNPFLGLERSLAFNMVKGVTDGFEKKLEMKGVGYRARMEGNTLVVEAGFSHPVKREFPDDIKVNVEEGKIVVSGIDKAKVGQIAAKIRKIRSPEPYKGKGIRYVGEEITLKEGKKAVGSE